MRNRTRTFLVISVLFIAAIYVILSGGIGIDKLELKKQKTKNVMLMQIPVMFEKRSTDNLKATKKDETGHQKITHEVQRGGMDRRKNKNIGYPNLFAVYEMPVKEYLAYMRSRGAKVAVYDLAQRRFVCEIMEKGILSVPSELKNLSVRTRRLTDDFPDRNEILKRIQQYNGDGRYEILLLIPKSLEKYIYKKITMLVEKRGLSMKDISTIFLTYRGSRSSLSIYVDKVIGRFGTVTIGETFRL